MTDQIKTTFQYGLTAASILLLFLLTASSSFAASPGELRIHNSSQFNVTYTVTGANWNCNDSPKPGHVIGPVKPNSSSDYFVFVRTDGHGCDGRQGVFQILPSLQTVVAKPQNFSYDSNGSIGLVPSNTNYGTQLENDGNNKWTWKVTPLIQPQ